LIPTTDSIFSHLLDDLADRVVAKMTFDRIQQSPESAARLLDVPAAAQYLSVTEHSVRHQIKKGQLPVVRRGSRVFIDRRDLDRQIDADKETMMRVQ
jgi:excisionase family DNA binding protein